MLILRRCLLTLNLLQASQLTAQEDPQLYWTTHSIEFAVESEELRAPLQRAMNIWNAVSCSSFLLTINPASSNRVQFSSANSQIFQSNEEGRPLAVTRHNYTANSPRLISQVDIFVNEETKKRLSQTDYQNILLHELGHVLGLQHSERFDSIMHKNAKTRFEPFKLIEEDIDCLCDLKPLTHLQARLFEEQQSSIAHQSDGGCSQAGRTDNLLLLLLAILWLGVGQRARFRQCVYARLAAQKRHAE